LLNDISKVGANNLVHTDRVWAFRLITSFMHSHTLSLYLIDCQLFVILNI